MRLSDREVRAEAVGDAAQVLPGLLARTFSGKVRSMSDREQALLKALAEAKRQIHELRSRIVRANGVAYVWRKVPRHPHMGNAREAEAQCGELLQRILGVDGDLSLKTALDEFARARQRNADDSH